VRLYEVTVPVTVRLSARSAMEAIREATVWADQNERTAINSMQWDRVRVEETWDDE
jgi:hypothetical protein